MAAKDAIDFLIDDQGDYVKKKAESGFMKEFADGKPVRSLLQRGGKTLEEALNLFDWKDDDQLWRNEYTKTEGADNDKLAEYRRRVYFCVGGWRDLSDDFGRGDVSCLRDIRTPLATSRTQLREARDGFGE